MPVMYAVGRRKAFRTLEEGEKAGYYPSFNALAQAQRKEVFGEPEPKPEQTAGYTNDEIKALAVSAGIETEGVHHKTLRKRVEEYLNAEVGGDSPSVCGTEDQRADGRSDA